MNQTRSNEEQLRSEIEDLKRQLAEAAQAGAGARRTLGAFASSRWRSWRCC